jgi:hypothetical protein
MGTNLGTKRILFASLLRSSIYNIAEILSSYGSRIRIIGTET